MSSATVDPMAQVRDLVGEWVGFLTPEERLELDQHLAALDETTVARSSVGLSPVPADWRARLKAVFPKHVAHPFAERHVAFWTHVDGITLGASPDPFVAVWPRGGGKSTGAELAVADLGCRDRRRYCLYVRETQLQADKSVQNIAALLESREVADHYPHHADRKVGKYGTSKGWNRERLTTAGGFVVDAVGLDTATRGLKFEEQRPDLIVFDDIDGKLDGPHITAKKEAILTHSILPAGSTNCAVLFVQNLIIPDGICSKLADGRADYLARRRVSGPFPAVEGLQYEWRTDAASGIRRAVITAGQATWAGQPLAACQHAIDSWGLQAFLKEAQHQVTGRAEGVALRYEAGRHLVDLTDQEAAQLIQRGLQSRGLSVFGGIDFGAWRFGFTLWVVTPAGIVTRVDEYFAQRLPGEASLTDRAKAIHAVCESYGIPVTERTIPIWGDAANPTDILELNLAFRNGWVDERGQTVTSRLRVVPVAGEHKARKTSVDRLNNLLDRNALQFRRGVRYEWRYGMNAGHEGTPQVSSRLLWEMENWAYPIPRPGDEQGQDPDDATADGADLCLVAGTPITTARGPVAIDAIEPGDMVLTRDGWRPVTRAALTRGDAEIWEVVLSDGRALRGTPNHPVFVDGKGFIGLAALRYGDTLLCVTEQEPKWQSSQSSSTASGSLGVQILRGVSTASISGRLTSRGARELVRSTARSGRRLMGRFQAGMSFITPTAIRSITRLKTSFVSNAERTPGFTATSAHEPTSRGCARTWRFARVRGLWNGCASSLTSISSALANCLGLVESRSLAAANGVVLNTPAERPAPRNTARTSVEPLRAAPLEAITNVGPADIADGSSRRVDSRIHATARVFVARNPRMLPVRQAVYNITVENHDGEGEYFANGILVHNCASMRYAIMSWWSPTRVPAHLTHYADDKAPPFDLRKQRFQPIPHAADLLTAGTRTPAVRMPRPRTSR